MDEKRAHARKSARHASETRWQNPNLALLYAVWRDKVKTGKSENGPQRKMNRTWIDIGVMGRYNEYDKYCYKEEGTSGHEE